MAVPALLVVLVVCGLLVLLGSFWALKRYFTQTSEPLASTDNTLTLDRVEIRETSASAVSIPVDRDPRKSTEFEAGDGSKNNPIYVTVSRQTGRDVLDTMQEVSCVA